MEPSPNDPTAPGANAPGAELEVYFCDLCNTSVPARDLELGLAKRIQGRLLGACCLKELAPKPASESRSMGAVGIVLTLAAIAGATVFLDRRIGDEVAGLGSKVATQVDASLARQADRLASIESRVAASAEKSDFGSVTEKLGDLQQKIGGVAEKAEVASANIETLGKLLGKAQESWAESQKVGDENLRRLEGSVRAIGDDLAALKAQPRSAPALADSKPAAADAATPPAPDASGLPRELQHQVESLTDSDAGVRFQAVAALVESKNPAVREPLLRMVKDPDVFVRRQVFEGLRTFRHASSVEALLVGLSDPVEIVRHSAHQSLVVLLGAKVAFDPNGSKEVRGAAVRKWREWWDENKKGFGS